MSPFNSSTLQIPVVADIPRHVAIIMDGNGRWAKRRFLPRVAGHRKGVDALRRVVRAAMERGIGHLTVFAFSSENWRRPPEEISYLMQLFKGALEREVSRLHTNGIRFRAIGDLRAFDERLVAMIRSAEALTRNNSALTLTIAANYGGRWDILPAVEKMLAHNPGRIEGFSEEMFAPHLALTDAPEPDLLIRTGGEQRISNFLLWQLAYAEFYFTSALWPEFGSRELDRAIHSYQQRERRFGRTSEQLAQSSNPEEVEAAGRNA